MSMFEGITFDAEEFSGRVRLFPLPDYVMYPHVMQPLHVFEPRYRELVAAALSGDQYIAMATLSPGWEQDYEGQPPLHGHACLGRIVAHHRHDDGRYNILLVGLRRIRLLEEFDSPRKFREARSKIDEDQYPCQGEGQRPLLRRQLLGGFRRVLSKLPDSGEQFERLLDQEVSLGMLTDIVAYTLNLPVCLKQRLLAETDVDQRARVLLQHVPCGQGVSWEEPRGACLTFPPEFSLN